MNLKKIGYIYALFSAIFFGSAGLFIKLAYKTGLDSINLLTLQYMIAVVLMFFMAFIKDKKMLVLKKNELFHLAVLGVVGNTFMTVFYYKAYEYLPMSMVTMLLYTYPIMVFIYLVIFKKEPISLKKTTAILLGFLGSALTLNLIFGELKYSLKGIIFGVLCAVFYCFMNIYSEKKLLHINALTINAYSTLFSLISLIIYSFPKFLFLGGVSAQGIVYTSILATFCEIIPLTLLYAAIKDIGSLKVSIINNLEIPIAMILSVCFLKEEITLSQIIGAILILYAIYLIRDKSYS